MTENASRMLGTAANGAPQVGANDVSALLRTRMESASTPAGQRDGALRNLLVAADTPASQRADLVAAHAWVPDA